MITLKDGEIIAPPATGETSFSTDSNGVLQSTKANGTTAAVTATATLAATATAPADATTFTAALNVSTTSLKGLQSAADKAKSDKLFAFGQGANLTDTDQTIQPGTDGKSQYVMPAGAQTANRYVRIGITNIPAAGFICTIVKPVGDAFTLSVQRSDGAEFLLIPANKAVRVDLYGNGTNYALSTWWYL
jgi:hypothetical protein